MTGKRPKPGDDGSGAKAAGVPEWLAPVIARALARDATAFESAKDFAHALHEVAPRARERTQLLEASPKARDALSGKPPAAAGPEQRRFARAPYRTPVRIEVPGLGARRRPERGHLGRRPPGRVARQSEGRHRGDGAIRAAHRRSRGVGDGAREVVARHALRRDARACPRSASRFRSPRKRRCVRSSATSR